MTWLIETKQQLLKCQMQTWCPYKFGFWSLIYCEQIDSEFVFYFQYTAYNRNIPNFIQLEKILIKPINEE